MEICGRVKGLKDQRCHVAYLRIQHDTTSGQAPGVAIAVGNIARTEAMDVVGMTLQLLNPDNRNWCDLIQHLDRSWWLVGWILHHRRHEDKGSSTSRLCVKNSRSPRQKSLPELMADQTKMLLTSFQTKAEVAYMVRPRRPASALSKACERCRFGDRGLMMDRKQGKSLVETFDRSTEDPRSLGN